MSTGAKRPRSKALRFAVELSASMPRELEWHLGGSWRRGAAMIGDLDVLVVTPSGTIEGVRLPACFRDSGGTGTVAAHGEIAAAGERIGCDIWACTPAQRGAFLMFITGPAALNIAQRQHAMRLGAKLSQYGLFKDGVQVDDGTEEDIYDLLGLQWLTPAERQRFAGSAPAPAQGARVVRVPSSSGTGWYDVRIEDGRAVCPCKSYTYRHRCRHQAAALAA